MKKLEGDLIKLGKAGTFDVIVHGCNCFCTMGAGIAKGIKAEFPEAFEADKQTKSGDHSKLGTISYAKSNHLIVVNAYTQFHWRGNGPLADYEAIRRAFRSVKASFSGKLIGYPAIGAGLAGGDWAVISAIIEEELQGEDHTYVVFKP
ncbi:MAG: macro domain-containing protein [Cytophagales bacterium]|nr:macro domain-containing protein [Cytophagales bacterium]